ncbi:hypothetical protein JW948_19365 [bacterium]|nr:hypothetical protein [bacterium]
MGKHFEFDDDQDWRGPKRKKDKKWDEWDDKHWEEDDYSQLENEEWDDESDEF